MFAFAPRSTIRSEVHPVRARDVRAALALLALILSSCSKGETGPTGPAGPAGPSGLALDIQWVGTPYAMRADGAMNQTLRARVADPSGNRVVGLPLRFKIVSGPGAIAPANGVTDDRGEATVQVTAGTTTGVTFVAAQADWAGLVISRLDSLYTDPLTVSAPVLASPSIYVLIPHWSPDGQSLIIEDPSAGGLVRVPVAGGASTFVGNYRGGQACPDGSARLVVSTSSDSVVVIDPAGTRLTPAFYPTPATGYFFGSIFAVSWAEAGASVATSSNTNALIAVTNLSGTGGHAWAMPVWATSISPVGATGLVVSGLSGPGSVYRIDLASEAATRLLSDPVVGMSVNRAGDRMVFSQSTNFVDRDLYVMPVAGGTRVSFLASPYDEIYPEWSPDGSKVAFCSNRSGAYNNIYIYTPSAGPAPSARLAAWSRPGPARPVERGVQRARPIAQ